MKPPITVVSTAIWWGNTVLLGHRCGRYSNDIWCLPGGKADDPTENLETAARREVREECGIVLDYLRPYNIWGEHVAEDGQVFTCVYFEASGIFSNRARVMEPEKIDQWRWFRLDELPERMFERERDLCYIN